jgi:hypothetical protein
MNELLWGIIYLVSIAFLITLFFNSLLRVRGPWGNFWAFFVIILLAVFAADIWVAPAGPYFSDVYWVPPLAVGLLIALLLAATTPSPRTRSELEVQKELEREDPAVVAFGYFFWFLLVFLFIIIVAGLILTV